MKRRNRRKRIRKPKGRPCKRKGIFGREKSMSVSSVRSIDEFITRKVRKEEIREKMEIWKRERGGRIFNKSKLIERLPAKNEEMIKELMEEVRDIRKEIKEQKEETRKEIKKMKAEMREKN